MGLSFFLPRRSPPAVQLGLTIDANTSALLSGSLRDQERVIDFTIERNGDVRSTTIRNSAGEVILHATASRDREKLELGTAATTIARQRSMIASISSRAIT